MDEKNLREKIKIIQNSDINQKEKNKKIFDLMNISSQQKKKEEKEEKIICHHYERECLIIAPCCNKVFPCRLCHDDKSDHKNTAERLVRKAITFAHFEGYLNMRVFVIFDR